MRTQRVRSIASAFTSGARLRTRSFALISAIGLALGAVAIGLPLNEVVAADKDKKPTGPQVSKKVIPPLKAAMDAYNAKQHDVALQKLQEAEAVADKTPYDSFRIEELRAAVYIAQNKYAEALPIYEQHLPNHEWLDPQVRDVRLKLMTQLAFQLQQHPKVLEYGKQWIAEHADDTSILDRMARSAYIQKDYKAALENVNAAIGVSESSGKTPEELWLQLVPSCLNNLNDAQGALAGYAKLVRYYPKAEHWNKSLEGLLASEKNDQAILYILRLMAETGVLNRPEYYLEYAQRANDSALPGEAAAILEAGYEKKVLGGGADKARHDTQRAAVQDRARKDKAQLPEIEKETRASKATTGQPLVGLGLAYFSNQMYPQAIQALEEGIAKGGVRNLDDTRMTLGIAYLRTGQRDKAREQFQKVDSKSPYARVAPFWVARTYNEASAPAAAPAG